MKSILSAAAVVALLSSGAALAQPGGHDNGRHEGQRGPGMQQGMHQDNGRHNGWSQDRGSSHRWNRGERMGYNDWNSAPQVDYRRYHLRQPPRGYEWRRQNNQFILVAAATGLIASIIMNAR